MWSDENRRFPKGSHSCLRNFAKTLTGEMVVLSTLVVIMITPGLLSAADPSDSKSGRRDDLLLKAASEMRKASGELGSNPDIAKRIRVLSWSLIVAEIASGPGGPELFTAANDAYEVGMKQLVALEALAKDKPELEEEISDTPELALRLDTVRVRLQAIKQKSALSRKEERQRLDSFRQLVRSYRSLTANLAAGNAQYLLGDHKTAIRQHVESAGRLADLHKVVTQSRTHWLFKDEPRLNDDKATETALVLTPADPFSDNIVAHVKALQALTAYRMSAPDDAMIGNVELIKNARTWAIESREANAKAGKSPTGHVIPGFVIAQVDRCLGLQLTLKSPLSANAHKQAQPHFQSAAKSLDEIAELVNKADGPFPGIRGEVVRRIAEIQSPDVFLDNAAELTARGLNEGAFAELGRGLAHHRSLELLLARAESGSRTTELLPRALEELQAAAESGLLPAADPHAQLVRARCELARLRDQIVGRSETPLAEADMVRMGQTLQRIASNMDAMQKKVPVGPLQFRISAYQALAVAYHSLVGLEPVGDPETIALRLAKSTSENLEVHLKGFRNKDRQREEIPIREALVAARIAQGHLAVRSLPDHRNTSSLAFTAAMDQQALLPSTGGGTRLLGSVLMESLLNRNDAQKSRLAMEERQLRIIMTQFTQGSFALHWKKPLEASDQMSRALDRLRGTSGKPAVNLSNAADILSGNASIDSPSDVLDSITAFTSMSHVAANRASVGLAVMMNQLANDGKRVTAESLQKQADGDRLKSIATRIPTALSGYALGLALENTVVQHPDLSPAVAAIFRQVARDVQQRVQALLAGSAAARERYHYIVALNGEAVRRLTSPDPTLELSQQLSGKLQFEEAESVLRVGLLLHPGNENLLAGLLKLIVLRCEQLTGEERQAVVAKAAEELDKSGAADKPVLAFDAAQLLEMAGRTGDALAAYSRSMDDDSASAEQKLILESKVVLLTALVSLE